MSRSPQSPSHAAFPLDLLPDEIVHRIGLFSPYRLAFPTGALNKTLYRIFRDPLAIAVRSLRSFYGNYVDGSPAEKAIAREASRGDAAVVERLMIKFGAQIDRRSPIEAAARNGHVAVVRLLLSHGATATNTTALAGAAGNGHIDVMQTLCDSGKCEQRERDASLSPAVQSGASKERRLAMLELLLEHGADPGAHRCFALQAAVEQREWDILRLLIERGRVGPGQAIDGALGALTEPNVDVVQHLLGLGAQPHVLHWDILLALATQGILSSCSLSQEAPRT
ncbi:ankyrin repeat-containing domain protein [Zopfochytrium polystomum]|nr:ankyrin repeat-containing domain protein [Zopfochytrium polystomum]